MSSGSEETMLLMLGTPNTGKSTLFNALTGRHVATGNYPGTTVDVARGVLRLGAREVTLVDVPGTVSLAASSDDERVAVRALRDALAADRPFHVLFVADAPRLGRSLYLLLQLVELGVPVVVALNLLDEARAAGVHVDAGALEAAVGVPVVEVVARTGEGLPRLRERLEAVVREGNAPARSARAWPHTFAPEVLARADALGAALGVEGASARGLGLWALVAGDDPQVPEAAALRSPGDDALAEAVIAGRYRWVDAAMPGIVREEEGEPGWTARLDRLLLHPLWGSLAFLVVMTVVFTALFSWAEPLIGLIEAGVGGIGEAVAGALSGVAARSAGAAILRDLLVDGVIGGVGAVVVFLPQIALLFLFLALLEDVGYLARAAAVMDRLLRVAGLPGRAFVPLLSGFACAVPAVLATRTLPRFRDRLLVMAVVPLTSCSARLPVYTLLVATLFPATIAGLPFGVRPLALFGLYLFSTALTVLGAIVLGRTLLADTAQSAMLELPPYRVPHLRTVARTVWRRSTDFLREAGTVILTATIVLWALLSFPRYEAEDLLPSDLVEASTPEELDALVAPRALEASFAGRAGKALEPVIAPLGFNWKIGVGLICAFAAREVFVSTLGVVYGIEAADEEAPGLQAAMRADRWPDGRPVFTALVGVSVAVFFAVAMQCLSTLAVLRKETGGWRWPLGITAVLTGLAWLLSFGVYQLGTLLGF